MNKVRYSLPVKLIILPILALALVFLLSLIIANKANAQGWGWAVPLNTGIDNTTCGAGKMIVYAETYDYASPNTIVNAGNITLTNPSGGSASGVNQTWPPICFHQANDPIQVDVAGNATWQAMGTRFLDGASSHIGKVVKVKILVKRQLSPHTVRNVSPLSGWVNNRNVVLTANVNDISSLGGGSCIDDINFMIDYAWKSPVSVGCAAPGNFTGTFSLADGNHFWTFEASDNAYTGLGKVSAFSSASWFSVDATAPLIVSTSHTPSTVYDSNTVTFSARAQDATSGLRWIEIGRSINGGSYATFPQSGNYWGAQDATLSRNGGPYPTGTNVCYQARARDIAANISSWTTPRCFDVISAPSPKPDLVIRNASGGTSPPITGDINPNVGDTVSYRAITKNLGPVGAGPFRTTGYIFFGGNACVGDEWENFDVAGLGANSTTGVHSFECTWTTAGVYQLRFTADINNNVVEENESNNTAGISVTVKDPFRPPPPCETPDPSNPLWVGDPNGDGFVDDNDLWLLSDFINGVQAPSPNQFEAVDMDANGVLTFTEDYFIMTLWMIGAISASDIPACPSPPYIDLEADFVTASASSFEIGEPITFRGSVSNVGNLAAGPFKVRYCFGVSASSCLVSPTGMIESEIGFPGLADGAITSVDSVDKIFTSTGTKIVWMCVDVFDEVLESNELTSSNCKSKDVDIDPDYPEPWIQTEKGNVGVIGEISMRSGTPPSGEVNADYLVIAAGAIDGFKSVKDWLVGSGASPYEINPAIIPTYDELKTKYSPTNYTTSNIIPSDGVFEYTGGTFTITNSTVLGSGSEPTVFFIDEKLTITRDQVNISRPILFIVRDRIFATEDVETLDGFYLTDNVFSTEDFPGNTDQLVVNGSVIANSFSLERTLEDDNDDDPAEKFIYQPSYLWHFREILGESQPAFEELAP